MNADSIISALGMQPLPIEGGYFSIVSRSTESVSSRCLYGTIYYLETTTSFSRLHQLLIDEVYYYHLGDPLEMLILSEGAEGEGRGKEKGKGKGEGKVSILGPDILSNQRPQILAPKGCIHGSRPLPGSEHGFTLLSTSMAPGYEDGDASFPARETLLKSHPQFESMICALTPE